MNLKLKNLMYKFIQIQNTKVHLSLLLIRGSKKNKKFKMTQLGKLPSKCART